MNVVVEKDLAEVVALLVVYRYVSSCEERLVGTVVLLVVSKYRYDRPC